MSRSAGRVHKRSKTRLGAAYGLPKWLRVLRNSLWTILHNIYHFSQLLQKTAYQALLQEIFYTSPHQRMDYCDTNAHDCDTCDAAASGALFGGPCDALHRIFAARARE
jgi:hypothetical protein